MGTTIVATGTLKGADQRPNIILCMATVFRDPETLHFGWNSLKPGQEWKPYGTRYWTPSGPATENLEGDDSRVIMDRAIPFIQEAANENKPFLAVIWFHAPHLPCVAGPRHAALYKDQSFQMQQYAGCVTAMDEQMGRLRAVLAELGVEGNTMLAFCSDNGPEGDKDAPGQTGGPRGRKRSLYDGGVRVPGLLVWPDKVKPRSTSTMAVTSDYMPTILEAAGIPIPAQARPLDGISLMPLLQGNELHRTMPLGFASEKQIALQDGRYKLYRAGAQAPLELYDLQADPFEQINLAAQNAELVPDLLAHFTAWYASCQDSFDGKDYAGKPGRFLPQKWPSLP